MTEKLESFLLTILIILFIVGGITIITVFIEFTLKDKFGEEIIVIEECNLENGQQIIGAKCSRKITCLESGLIFKNCDQIRKEIYEK